MSLFALQSDSSYSEDIHTPYFFALDREALGSVLEHPYHLFLELGQPQRLEAARAEMQALSADFALSLTGISVRRHNVPRIVAAHLCATFGIQASKCLQMETCLQEALANAVIHGNLAMESRFASPDDMSAYYAHAEALLCREPYRSRRVLIAAWAQPEGLEIAVGDEGGGFRLAPDRSADLLPHGRGLFLIRSLASAVRIGAHRRMLHMTITY